MTSPIRTADAGAPVVGPDAARGGQPATTDDRDGGARFARLGANIEPLLPREYDYGSYEGLTTDEIEARAPGWDIWDDGCRGGETTDDVAARADRFLASVRAAPGPVVAVTHGHMSRILAMRAVALPARCGSALGSATGSLSMIEEYRGRPVLTLWTVVAGKSTI